MPAVPHCPECGRADTVSTRDGPGYEYYCRRCALIIDPDDVWDAAWIDMVVERMFDDPDAATERAAHQYSEDCECHWCTDGRPGLSDIPTGA